MRIYQFSKEQFYRIKYASSTQNLKKSQKFDNFLDFDFLFKIYKAIMKNLQYNYKGPAHFKSLNSQNHKK